MEINFGFQIQSIAGQTVEQIKNTQEEGKTKEGSATIGTDKD
jgi:hypothetical protein